VVSRKWFKPLRSQVHSKEGINPKVILMPYKDKEKEKEYQKRYRDSNKEARKKWENQNRYRTNAYSKNRYYKRKELGLCQICCKKPLDATSILCLECKRYMSKAWGKHYRRNIIKYQEKNFKMRKIYKEMGKCINCSKELNPDCDNGRVTCLNCREGIHRERIIYGNAIV